MFSAPNMKCPKCNGRIDPKHISQTSMFGAMVFGDIVTYAIAGLLALIGFMWEPAWAIAFVLVCYLFLRRSAGQTYWVCSECQREYTYKDLYASKP